MNDLEMAAKFREAARYLRVHGWCQGWLGDQDGRACLVGAAYKVGLPMIHFNGAEPAIKERPYQVLEDRLGQRPALWNDDETRTAEEVIALLEDTAHDLELRHQIAASTPAVSSHEAILPTLKEAVPVA